MMENILELEKRIIYPYFKDQAQDETDSQNGSITSLLELVAVGSYVEALQMERCQDILVQWSCAENFQGTYSNTIAEQIRIYLENGSSDEQLTLFAIGVACLQIFVQNNFTGPLIGPPAAGLLYSAEDEGLAAQMHSRSVKELVLDTEGVYSLIAGPEYLLIARIVLYEMRGSVPASNSVNWWCCRYSIVHQKIADEKSPKIYNSILESIKAVDQSPLFSGLFGREIEALFHLEIGHIHLYYFYVNLARFHFDRAQAILSVEVSMTGALGKRTKWQQSYIPQLVLKLEYKGHPITASELADGCDTLLSMDLPKDLLLSDDTRLNMIYYKDRDEDIVPNLQPIEQAYLLAGFFLMSKASAHDSQLEEEMKVYLHSLLQHPKNWAIQQAALIHRSRIETTECRAMERSLGQLEELTTAIGRSEPSPFHRLKLIYGTHLLPQWYLQQELANTYIHLGCCGTALLIFKRIHLWEDVITCYNRLGQKTNAANIIRQQLKKEKTTKLLCL